MTIKVSAGDVAKNFGAFADLAQVEPVSITKYGREHLVLLSASQFAQLQRVQPATERIRAIADTLRAHGATALYVYGSRARGDHRSDSDLDVFVEYDPAAKFSLMNLAAIRDALEDALKLEAHVTTRDSLDPELRPGIEREAVRIF